MDNNKKLIEKIQDESKRQQPRKIRQPKYTQPLHVNPEHKYTEGERDQLTIGFIKYLAFWYEMDEAIMLHRFVMYKRTLQK